MKAISGWLNWRTPSGYRWYIFLVLSFVYFLACLHRIAPTIIARDLVREFSAGATALGFMASAYFYLYAAVQPPVGVLSDTWGPRLVTTLFAVIACAGALLFGLAPNMTVATLGRALIGAGVGGVFVPALKVFSKWFHAQTFAAMTGIFLAMGNAGNLAASLPLTYLVIQMGWRMSFAAIGALSLMMALVCWIVVRDQPKDKGWPDVAVPAPAHGPLLDATPAGMTTLKRLGMVLGRPEFWMVTGSYFFFGGPTLGFQGLWTVPYLIDVHGLTRVQAGGILMLMPLGFVFGSPLFGILADRLPVGRKTVVIAALIIVMFCWGVFIVFGGHPPITLVPFLFFLIGFCGGGALSLFMTMNKELFPVWLTGTAMGLMNPAAFLSTALFQPFSGYLMDTVGRSGETYPLAAYYKVLLAIFITAVLSLIMIMPVSSSKKGLRD
ncbi:MAG: MFS transporter [Desulfobacteraceae bacterium]|nr:MFS transporter [Desulfobacteraceae bacterium]